MEDFKSKNIELWLAKYMGETIAGAICFYHKSCVVYWHGAALSDYFRLRPVNLLMYKIIENACNRKARWFDFNPSGGHEGVKRFKKSFGARSLEAPIFTSTTYFRRVTSIIRKKMNFLLE